MSNGTNYEKVSTDTEEGSHKHLKVHGQSIIHTFIHLQ